MGHKAIAIFDMDHLARMERDPGVFVQRLIAAILAHRRTGGSVSMDGATFVNVVWSGHVSQTPILQFHDFRAKNVTYDVIFKGPKMALRPKPEVEVNRQFAWLYALQGSWNDEEIGQRHV